MPSPLRPYFRLGWLLPLLCAVAPRTPLAPRPDYAGRYRDAPHLEVATRREGDSLRRYLEPLEQFRSPGQRLIGRQVSDAKRWIS